MLLSSLRKNCFAYFAVLTSFCYLQLPLQAQKGDQQAGPLGIYETPRTYRKMVQKSFYLPMRDGVELACDLFLPKGLEPGAKIPTIMHLTRYWRAADIKWPYSALAPDGPPSLNPFADTEAMVRAGYAVLSVDARGSGASFGSEIMAMGPDEVADGKDLMDWVVAQSWSDGQIASMGISYNGWAAQMLATTGHPALKAIFTVNSPFDGYDDMAIPGGVLNHGLVNEWSKILRNMDQGRNVSSRKFLTRIVKGPMPIPGRELALDSALRDHRANGYADGVLNNIVGRDDPVAQLGNRNIDNFFPVGYQERLAAANIPVYAMSGWYDMANPHGAVRIFHNYGGGRNKLIIGPWNHFLIRNISPFGPDKTKFEHISEVMKFFDYHLKGRATGLDQEAPVHYYTMGEERWKSAASWPPLEVQAQGWFLQNDGKMLPQPSQGHGQNVLHVDTTLHTGTQTRWDLSFQNFSTYAGLDTLQQHLLTYTSPPLMADKELTGHPSLRLYIGVAAPDAAIFAYLEDISPDGTINMITEGHLQVRHAKIAPEAEYDDVVVSRTFLSKDVRAVMKNTPSRIEFDLLPCSWRVKKGHQIRLALSGSDRDHFKTVDQPADIDIYWGQKNESLLVLPIMPINP